MAVRHDAGGLQHARAPRRRIRGGKQHAAHPRDAAPGERLRARGFRAVADLRNEKINYKIREHSLQKLPYQLVAGDREMQAGTVAVRTRGGEDLGAMPVDAFLDRLQSEARIDHSREPGKSIKF